MATMAAFDVIRKLRSLFPAPAHTLLSEVRNGTGYSRRTTRTADALAISTWPSRGLWIAGIEVKVYRSDWKKELADAAKADEMMQWCNYWYVAAPAGLVQDGELPKTWGLIEVGQSAKVKTAAPELTPKTPDLLFLCSVLRNFSESHVHKDSVREEAERMAVTMKERESHHLAKLREDVDTFEKSSGVTITEGWNNRQIGEAVKIVLESRLLHGCDRIAKLRADAEFVADACRRIEQQAVRKDG